MEIDNFLKKVDTNFNTIFMQCSYSRNWQSFKNAMVDLKKSIKDSDFKILMKKDDGESTILKFKGTNILQIYNNYNKMDTFELCVVYKREHHTIHHIIIGNNKDTKLAIQKANYITKYLYRYKLKLDYKLVKELKPLFDSGVPFYYIQRHLESILG